MNEKSIFVQPINGNEIVEIKSSLRNKKGGIDGINKVNPKILTEHISNPLVHIINIYMEKGIWAEELKKAERIPMHKTKKKHLPNNCRAISLIPSIYINT